MANNEILPFAGTDTGTNLLTQAEYNADSQRPIGNQPGVARSKLVNKVLRQTSLISSAIAQYFANRQSSDITDSLSAATLAGYMLNAIGGDTQKNSFNSAIAAGTADAITASYTPAVAALTNGLSLFVRATAANTSTTPTFTPNSGVVTAKAIVKGANQALVAGDIAGAGHWLEIQYDSNLDRWVLQNPATGIVSSGLHGQCRLAKSGANLLLSPFNGNNLVIAGSVQKVPSAGVSLAPTGLLAATLYYVYAYMNAGTMTLEASTTGHSTDAASGVEIKTGDASRTLVGMAYCKTAATFTDTDTQRLVASWFNRTARKLFNFYSAARSSTSTTLAEINSEIRCEFVCWDDESCQASFLGQCSISTAGNLNSAVGWDGPNADGILQTQSNASAMFTATGARVLSEGFHYVTGIGNVSTGTGTWGTSSTGARCYINGVIR